uniref:Uncharacterized protein n=4 Tax=Triticinae TaxID=1648030 RepID=A0A453SF84_AEGTS
RPSISSRNSGGVATSVHFRATISAAAAPATVTQADRRRRPPYPSLGVLNRTQIPLGMASQEKPITPSPAPPAPPQPPTPEGAPRIRGFGGGAAGGGYPNPPDAALPDAATLRDQWRFAVRQYSRWYSQAWGTAILAGGAFFALGWLVKGSNPLPSRADPRPPNDANADEDKK